MILASGCFDGLHAGHVAYLEAASQLTGLDEPLAVAVAPDDYIRTAKGREPYWTQAQRAAVVERLRSVSQVLRPYEASAAATILQTGPRVFVKGADWAGRLPDDVVSACCAVDCLIVYVETPGKHTSEAHQ